MSIIIYKIFLTWIIRENELKFSTIPRGNCKNCCPINIDRDVRFLLYTKNGPTEGVPIRPLDEVGAAKRAGVDPNLKTVIYIHGFSETSPGASGSEIVNAYLNRPDEYNIILVDWTELSVFPWYRPAVQNVKLVGQLLYNFIKIFHKSGEMPVQNLHVIGFSLGCHVASMAGKNLQGDIRIPRITALDPAYPEFPVQDRAKRLASTDADYIDVIHTDGGIFGYPVSIGHADFYPNGGKALQPGCQPSYLVRQNIVELVVACSHVRAWQLYAESVINPSAFPATYCGNWTGPEKECNFTIDGYMGFASNQDMKGQFFLRTGHQAPYGLTVGEQH
ncbi:hypothetical protein GWI33_013384 [Rhynchophorus ferrugineus]|uniref:Lipase domain-containing protein n=1 Tax=Rhynchophorus ferrugineus TaxID=354439 RepID=A0A834I9A7_RHYFE|nr:hypothetical protein GWI33_013384 [Rhynchophorus ferrugineus]